MNSTPSSFNADRRSMRRNAATAYATLLATSALGLVVTPVLLHGLGETQFGIWAVLLNLATYLGLAELGLGLATITRTSSLEHEGPVVLSRLASTARSLLVAVAGVGLFALVGLIIALPHVVSLEPRSVAETRLTLLLLGSAILVTISGSVYSNLLIGTGRLHVSQLTGSLLAMVVSASSAAAIAAGAGMVWLGAATLVGAILQVLLQRRAVKRHLPSVTLGLHRFDTQLARDLGRLGWRNSINNLAAAIAFGGDVLIVGLILRPALAAGYAVAAKGFTLVRSLAVKITEALGAAHTHARVHSSRAQQMRLFETSVLGASNIALPAAIGICYFRVELLHLWVGTPPPGAAAVLLLLLVTLTVQIAGYSAFQVMVSREQSRELTYIVVPAALLNLALSVAATLSLGVIGPAVGSLIVATVFDFFILPFALCKLLETSWRAFVARLCNSLALPAAAMLVTLLATSALGRAPLLVGLRLMLGGLTWFGVAWMQPGPGRLRVLIRKEEATPRATTKGRFSGP